MLNERLHGSPIHYHVDVEEECNITPEDSYESPEDAAAIRRQVAAGNALAWCCITVTARVTIADQMIEACAYLGGCSFASEDAAYAETIAELTREAREDLDEELAGARIRAKSLLAAVST